MDEELQKSEDLQLTRPDVDPLVGRVLASWSYPEYIAYQRGMVWYIVSIIITLALLFYAFVTENNLFMIIIILAVVIFIIANTRKPEEISFGITDGGIIVKDKFLPYVEIKNFWMIYQPPHVKTLYFEPHSFFSPRIQVHLENQRPTEIRDLLLQYLNEDLNKEEEPQSEAWGRLFKL